MVLQVYNVQHVMLAGWKAYAEGSTPKNTNMLISVWSCAVVAQRLSRATDDSVMQAGYAGPQALVLHTTWTAQGETT